MELKLLAIVALICSISAKSLDRKFEADPEMEMDALQLIQYWGYPGEQHAVTTSDGYILDIQRIPYGKGQTPGPREVVFLQHGLEGCSTNWLSNLPTESLGYILADAGYDVWLGNFRGNTYGLHHDSLSPKGCQFWKFSWDEMASKDLPAMIDFALDKSGSSSLYYVGHSEGSLTAFAEFSSDLEFAKKIKKFFALGPVVTVKHVEGPISYIARFTNEVEVAARILGACEFNPSPWLLDFLSNLFCADSTLGQKACENLLFLIGGPNSHQTNMSRIPVYMSHNPAGTSTQNIIHFGQMINSGLFQMYKYPHEYENIAKYGQPTAPLYHLKNMQVPTALFWGDLDWLADKKDIQNSILPYVQNLIGNFEYADFNHLDFIWGLNAAKDVYSKILTLMKE